MRAITIIAATSLKEQLCKRLKEWGACNWSVQESINSGSRGCHSGDSVGSHVRIEAIVENHVADQILTGLQAEFFQDCSVVFFVSDVFIRPGKDPRRDSDPGAKRTREEAWGDYLITL
jgi:hypothetical protein